MKQVFAHEDLLKQVEDHELGLIIKARQSEKSKAIKVSLDDL